MVRSVGPGQCRVTPEESVGAGEEERGGASEGRGNVLILAVMASTCDMSWSRVAAAEVMDAERCSMAAGAAKARAAKAATAKKVVFIVSLGERKDERRLVMIVSGQLAMSICVSRLGWRVRPNPEIVGAAGNFIGAAMELPRTRTLSSIRLRRGWSSRTSCCPSEPAVMSVSVVANKRNPGFPKVRKK